jgi:hypothetical protein
MSAAPPHSEADARVGSARSTITHTASEAEATCQT